MSRVYARMVPSFAPPIPTQLHIEGVDLTDRAVMELAAEIRHAPDVVTAIERREDRGVRFTWRTDIIGIPLVLAKWDDPNDQKWRDSYAISGRGWTLSFAFERERQDRQAFDPAGNVGALVREKLDHVEAFRRDYCLILLALP